MIGGVALATAAITTLFKLFTNYWDFLDKKVLPAQAEFNKQLGGTKASTAGLRKEMISTGVEFETLGYSFEEGAQLIRDFASGLRQVEIPKAVLKTGKELTAILGLTGEEAGKTIMYFQKQGAAIENVNEMFDQGAKTASAYGLPINDVLRDMGQAPDIMARFGIANRKEFAIATAKARSYGLSIKEVNASFGKSMATFNGASEASAKLNSVFGTTINSFQLMLEKNPVKRMEMIRKELDKQGKSWEKLSDAEKYVVTDTLHISEAQAAMAFSSEDQRKKLEKQAKQRENLARIDEKWNQGMGSIKKTLIAWGPLLDKLMRSVSNFIARLFGFKSAQEPIQDFAKTAERMINDVTAAIDQAGMKIDQYREKWYSITEPLDSGDAQKIVDLLRKQEKTMADVQQLEKLYQNKDAVQIAEVKARNAGLNEDLIRLGEQVANQYGETVNAMDQATTSERFSPEYKQSVNAVTGMINESFKPVPPKQAEVLDQKKAKKSKEEREKERKLRNKEMTEPIVDAIERANSQKQEIVLKTMDGSVLGKGIIKSARGSK